MESMDRRMGEMMGKMAFTAMEEMPKIMSVFCGESGWPGMEAPKIMGDGTISAAMWEGMLPTWVATGLGKVVPNMDKKRVTELAKNIIAVVKEKAGPVMSEKDRSTFMGSTWAQI